MSAIRGLYRPAKKVYMDWAFSTIYRPLSRAECAQKLNLVRHTSGRKEQREFRNYLLWLGTYPVSIKKT